LLNGFFLRGGKSRTKRPQCYFDIAALQEEPELKIYQRKSDFLMEDIEAGQVQIHPSRQPIYKKKLSNAMNNVQRMLLLKGGAEGEWNPRAQMRLESLLANPSLLWSRT